MLINVVTVINVVAINVVAINVVPFFIFVNKNISEYSVKFHV
jgi:branched-subunit amino acid transport protein AzlD